MTQTKAELLQTRHQGDIRLGDANSSHYVGFKAPATVGSNLVWTLPAADGTANYLLKTDGSGNLGWVADSSTDSTKMPLAGGTFTGNTIYNDNAKAIFGTSSDGVEIYHSGSGAYIKDSGTGDLIINSNTIRLKNAANDEHLAIFDQNSYCSLYYDNVKKFETYGSGIKAYNHVRVEGLEGENAVLALYADEGDDAADLWIMAANTSGALEIQQWNGSAWEDVIKATGGGAVELFYNDVKTFETIATGATITSSATTGITFTKPSGSAPQIQFRANSVDAASEIKVSESLGGGILEVKTKTTGGTLTLALSLNTKQSATFASAIYGPVKTVSALQLDLSTSNYFIKTISGNSTFTFANPAASGTVTAFTLELTHSSGTVTWPSEVKWNADTAPTLTTGKTHLFMFVTDDGGSRYRGSALVDYVN